MTKKNDEILDLNHQCDTACQNLRDSIERLTAAIRATGGIVPDGFHTVGSHRCTFAEDVFKLSGREIAIDSENKSSGRFITHISKWFMGDGDDKTLADCKNKFTDSGHFEGYAYVPPK